MFKNYFKPTSKKIEQILLALKGFIGTVAVSSLVQGHTGLAAYFLLGGAFIDFLMRCSADDASSTTDSNNKS